MRISRLLTWQALGLVLLIGVRAEAQQAEQAPVASDLSASDAAAPVTEGSIPVPAANADEKAKEPEKHRSSRLIEEVVVTAQKREENLQDVPISVAAFSSEKLDALGVKDARDLQLVTPGLVYSTNPVNYSIIYIRGIGNDAFIPSVDSSVATYVDGVYFPYNHGLASSFSEIERIEVLKGPQGTLFGRNTTGGAINIVTKKPDGDFRGQLSQSVESYSRMQTKGFITGSLFDGFAASIGGLYDDGNTYYKPAEDSPVQDRPSRRDAAFSVKLHWTPTDTTSATLTGFHSKSYNTLVNTAEATKPLGIVVGVKPGEPHEYDSNLDGYLRTKNQVGSLVLEWQPDAFNSKLFGSYQEVHAQTLYDFDGSSVNAVYFDVPTEFVRATSAELQFQSKPDGFFTFGGAVEWTAGYYFYKSRGGYANVFFGVLAPDQPSAGYPITPTGLLGSALDIISAAGITLQDNVELELNGLLDTIAHAAYMQTSWHPLDWFGLTLGARVQHEERETIVARAGLSRRPADPLPLFNFPLDGTKTDDFSPKLTLEFRPFGDDTMLYATAQKGFKSGTYNVVALYTKPNYVKPEEVTAYELGIKGKLLDGNFVYSAAAFQSRIKNLQTLNISLTSGGAVQLANAKEAEVRGAEAEFTWQLMPELNPGLVLTGSSAYLHGRYTDFENASGFDPVTGLYFGRSQLIPHAPVSFTGNTMVRTPEWSGTLGLNQTLEVPGGSLEIGANATYSAMYYFDTQNLNSNPSYTLFNGRLSYLYEPWNVRFSGIVQNITNEKFFYDKLVDDFGTNAFYGPNRTWGVTVDWNF